MTPYEILGVTPTTSISEIEARYRLLLREYHPDLHQDEGPEAIAYCEAMTRSINSAMERVRVLGAGGPSGSGWATGAPPGGGPGAGAGPGSAGFPGSGGARTSGQDGPTWNDPPTYSQWFGDNPFYRPAQEPREPAAESTFARDWFGDPVQHAPDEPVPCPLCGEPFEQLADYEWHLRRAHRFKEVVPTAPRPRSRWSVIRLIGALRFIPAWFVALCAFALWGTVGFYGFVGAMVFLSLVMWTQQSPIFKRR